MLPILILIRPLDLKTGNRVDIRVGSAADATALGLDGKAWEPIVSRRPRIAQDLMSLDLDGKFKLAAADLILSLNEMRQYRSNRLYWSGAKMTIWSVEQLSWDRRIVEFDGIISSPPTDRNTKKLTINATVDRTRVDKPLLTGEFNADGQAGGGPEMRGTPYPAGFGYVENVEWVLFDKISNIGMLDGYGNLLNVSKAFEGASSLGASVGDYPTYASLRTAITSKEIVPGRWGTCLAQGMVGLGAPPTGRITFIATFGSNRTGAILQRVLKLHAGVPDAEVDAASFIALDNAANMEVRAHFTDQIQCSDVIEAMVKPLNATPLITVQNKIAISLSTPSVPVAELNANGSVQPAVTDWRIADPIIPIYAVAYRAERPATTLSYDEVNYVDTILDRGLYSATEVYRQGNLVWLADKSAWLYINPVPSAGHAPPAGTYDVDQWWQNVQPALDASNIRYGNGDTLESLKPAGPGATAGAPAGTYVGDKEAFQLIADLQAQVTTLAQQIGRVDLLRDLLAAIGYVEGQTVGNKFLTERTERIEGQNALQNLFSVLASLNPEGTAAILRSDTTVAGVEGTIATAIQSLVADNGLTSAAVQQLQEAFIDPEGSAFARALLQVVAGDTIAGLQLLAGGPVSAIKFIANIFQFTDPNGGTPITPFYYKDGILYLDNVYVNKLTIKAVADTFIQDLALASWTITVPGGFIIKGGRLRQNINNETGFSVIFNGAFPEVCLGRFAIAYIVTANNERDLWLQNLGEPSVNGCSFYTQAARSAAQNIEGIDWFAVGR